jgi:transposase InsO family protein
MKYQFIEQYKQEFPIVVMCRVLGVSESGFYAWRKRPESSHARKDAELTTQIQALFVHARGLYGSPRIFADLCDLGVKCSRRRVARLMRENGLDARRKPFHPVTTKSNPKHSFAPNLLQQDFTASRPNAKWTGDITYVPTGEGWLYLAVMLDVFSRRVIGWAMSTRCDELLVETALNMALARRQPGPGLLHHTDRGSQYTSQTYQRVLEHVQITVSMSGKGNCYDNAVTESFFGTVKDECVHRTVFPTREDARRSLFEYLEVFYNRQRRHASLGYLSPVSFEQQWEFTASPMTSMPESKG